MSDLKKDTIRGVKWSAFNAVANRIVTFLLGVILARLLSPADFGIVGMTAIFFALAAIIVDSGLSTALIRKKEVTQADCSTIFYFNIVVSGLCFIILYLCSGLIAEFLRCPILTDIVKVSAVAMVISSFGSVQSALMAKAVNFKTPALVALLANIVSGSVGIVLAYQGYGPWAIVFSSLVSVSVNTGGLWVCSEWRPAFIFSWQSFKELFGFSSNIMLNAVLDRFYNEGTGMVIGKYYSPDQLGYFTRGQHTAQLPSTVLNNIVSQVTLPVLSKIQDDEERLIASYGKMMRILSFVIFFAIMLLIALARPLVILLYTEKWLPAVIFLQILSLRFMLFHINSVNWNLLMVKGYSGWALRKEILNKTVTFGLLFLAVPFGVECICWGMVASAVFSIIVNTWVAGHLFGYGMRRQMRDFLPYLIYAVVACAPAYALTWADMPSLAVLVIGGLISSTIYFGYMFLTKDECLAELIRLTPLRKFCKI